MAVVRLRAKIDTWVNDASTRRTRNVPITASAPMPRGSEAATTLPNTSTSRMRMMGRLIISARTRSCSIWVLTWRNTSAKPPTATLTTAPSGRV